MLSKLKFPSLMFIMEKLFKLMLIDKEFAMLARVLVEQTLPQFNPVPDAKVEV